MVTAAEWAERIERWTASGLTAREFGKSEGIDPKQLAWWKWRLGTQQRKAEKPAFLPVRVVQKSRPPVLAAPIELLIGSDLRVRVWPGFDVDSLDRVLAVARRSSC